ncbi:YesL family protein [Domibacillus indicus]|uniref:YesL family protein n=1 Tax=Domibacillus indicus TaxID=1437523 RepID=UPI000617BB2B|nr:YesL family protein [Domibacillus indicus]
MNSMLGGMYRIAEWLMKLAYLNLLWLLFTLAGGFVLGFFPATTSMFGVIRKLIMGNEEQPIFKMFWQMYKKEFIRSNRLGIIVSVAGYMLYFDVMYLRGAEGILGFIYYPILIVLCGFILTLFYLFPIFVHYEITVFQAVKNAFWIMVLHPLSTILMIAGTVTLFFLLVTIPGLIPFFSVSGMAFVLMWAALLAFAKAEEKQKAAA